VILTQRDLVSAQGAELRALANLLEAKAAYERAVGRTLEVNRVSIADAKHGEVDKDTLIPGTLHGKVVGTEDLITCCLTAAPRISALFRTEYGNFRRIYGHAALARPLSFA